MKKELNMDLILGQAPVRERGLNSGYSAYIITNYGMGFLGNFFKVNYFGILQGSKDPKLHQNPLKLHLSSSKDLKM